MISLSQALVRNSRNMYRMLQHVTGGDVRAFDIFSGSELAAETKRCLTCNQTLQCERWLDNTAQHPHEIPDFCPVKKTLWEKCRPESLDDSSA